MAGTSNYDFATAQEGYQHTPIADLHQIDDATVGQNIETAVMLNRSAGAAAWHRSRDGHWHPEPYISTNLKGRMPGKPMSVAPGAVHPTL